MGFSSKDVVRGKYGKPDAIPEMDAKTPNEAAQMTEKQLIAMIHELQTEVSFLRGCIARLTGSAILKDGDDGAVNIVITPREQASKSVSQEILL